MSRDLPPLQQYQEALLVFLAGDLIGRITRHPEAPEGIEFFEWHWYPWDRMPHEIVFLRPLEKPMAFWTPDEQALMEPHPVETDSVRPSGPHGTVVVADPGRSDGVRSLPWEVGWNRLARKGVLWFANGRLG